jgi:crotonobetainyl-CoA:carnitine CoA-transferase CaiB-like acyl-CoA transferase
MAPLSGCVVLDLTEWVAGPACTKLLADYGARVLKVERPGGDPARRMGPFPDDIENPELSAMFLHLNTNKESVALDPDHPDGNALLRALASRVDIVVESYKPGTLAKWGLAPCDLIKSRPDLVVTSITAFGQTGPYCDWEMTDIVAFAMGGPMNASGEASREPVKLAGNMVLIQSGAAACVATLGALFHARQDGVGQHVDVATFETQNGNLDRRRYYLQGYQYSGFTTKRATTSSSALATVGGRFRCSDGKEISTGPIFWPYHLERMVKVIGDAELTDLWNSRGPAVLGEVPDKVNERIARWAAGRTAREAMQAAIEGRWPVVTSNDPLMLLTDEHLVSRDFWVKAKHCVAGELSYPGPPFRINGRGWKISRAAPMYGQDTDQVLGDFVNLSSHQISDLRAKGAIS